MILFVLPSRAIRVCVCLEGEGERKNVLALSTLVILVPPPVCDERVEHERGFGVCQGRDVLKLAELELCAGLLVSLGWSALAHCALGVGGHVCGVARCGLGEAEIELLLLRNAGRVVRECSV